MPFFSDPNMEEDQNQQTQGGQNIVSGAGGVVTGQAGGQGAGGAAAGPDAKQSRSGSWSNLVQYLDANKGNDSRLGQGVKGSVDAQAQQANDAQKQFETSANKAINEGASRDPSVLSQVQNGPISQFKQPLDKNVYSAQYKGPNSAEDINEYAAAQQQTNKVQDTTKLADQGHEGRVQLLDQTYGRPSYSSGEKNLDSFILGGGEGGAKALGDIKNNYADYGQKWQGLVGSVNQNAAQAKADTDNQREAIKAAAQKQVGSYNDLLNQRVAQENSRRQSLDANKLGFIEQQARNSYDKIAREQLTNAGGGGRNLSDYLSFGDLGQTMTGNDGAQYNAASDYYTAPDMVNATQMANADEAQGYNALLELLGSGQKITPEQMSAAQRFNESGYQNKVRELAASKFKQAQDSALARINKAKSGAVVTDQPTEAQYKSGNWISPEDLRNAYKEAGYQLPDQYR